MGCPSAAASAPVLCGVRCRGRQCGRATPLCGASPRSPRSAVGEGRSRVRGALRGRRLVGAAGCVGPGGVTLQFARALSGARLGATRRELNLAHRRSQAPRLLSLPRALCFVRSRRSAMQLPDDFTGSFSRAAHAGSAAARQIASTSSRAPKVGTAADAPAAALVRDQSGESVERDQTSTLASRCETMTMASRDGICL